LGGLTKREPPAQPCRHLPEQHRSPFLTLRDQERDEQRVSASDFSIGSVAAVLKRHPTIESPPPADPGMWQPGCRLPPAALASPHRPHPELVGLPSTQGRKNSRLAIQPALSSPRHSQCSDSAKLPSLMPVMCVSLARPLLKCLRFSAYTQYLMSANHSCRVIDLPQTFLPWSMKGKTRIYSCPPAAGDWTGLHGFAWFWRPWQLSPHAPLSPSSVMC
jgi:hypothetical protein